MNTETKTYQIDATGKSFGRVASEAAVLLMGKNTPAFAKHMAPDVAVTISNTAKMVIRENKRLQKEYAKYSGYPGGLTFTNLEKVIASKGTSEVVRRAIYGMLPHNRLRAPMMKRLTITD